MHMVKNSNITTGQCDVAVPPATVSATQFPLIPPEAANAATGFLCIFRDSLCIFYHLGPYIYRFVLHKEQHIVPTFLHLFLQLRINLGDTSTSVHLEIPCSSIFSFNFLF